MYEPSPTRPETGFRTDGCRALLAALALACLGAAGPDARPHVLILLADDLGWRDVGYHGAPIETPQIDRLAREGVELDRFYVQPVCTPTRAALLTGRAPVRAGLGYGVVRPWDYFGLPPGETLLSEVFAGAGYQTAVVGKWHLGHSHRRYTPNQRGFEHFYGHLLGAIDYWSHSRFGGLDWQRNGSTLREPGYSTKLVGREAARVIRERDRERPLFLYVPFNAPHSPMQAPPELVERYAELPDQEHLAAHAAFIESVALRLGLPVEQAAGILDPPGEQPRAVFAAMVHALDAAIGEVLAALDAAGMSENTLVVFASDNGGHIALGASNLPLRGEKSTVFEGGIRVPAAMRWPAGLDGGRRVSQTLSAMDVFPTLLAATGVEAQSGLPLDGVDRWAQIRGAAPVPAAETFFAVDGVQGVQQALRSGRWKLIRNLGFARSQPPSLLLFDVESDPGESMDRSASQPGVVDALLPRLEYWADLNPPGAEQVAHWPHPGWIPPADYNAAVRGDASP